MSMIETKEFKFELKDITKAGEFEGYASTRSRDSYGDIVAPKAFSKTLKENKGKVPILWMHDPSQPLGMSHSMVEDEKGLFTKGMIDTETELGTRVLSGMRKGYISEMSIGYKTIKSAWDKDQNANILKEIKLLEYSMITKGFAANRDSVVTAVKREQELERRIAELEQEIKQHMQYYARIEELEEKITELEKLKAEPLGSTRPFALPEPDESTLEKKDVIGSSDLPVVKGDWDASSAEKRIWEWANGDTSKVKRAYFWLDGDPENKSSYKLPFADVRDGKLVAISNALSAVKGALNGARGGVEGIPDADKKRIMSKVEDYEKRLDDEEKAFFALQELKKMLKEMKGNESRDKTVS